MLPFSSPGGLPHPGIEPKSPVLQADSLPTELHYEEAHMLHSAAEGKIKRETQECRKEGIKHVLRVTPENQLETQ